MVGTDYRTSRTKEGFGMKTWSRLVLLVGCIGALLLVVSGFLIMQHDWATSALLIKPAAYLMGASALGTILTYIYALLRK